MQTPSRRTNAGVIQIFACLLSGALCSCGPIPGRLPCPGSVSEVTYIAHSGPVLEPWTETVLISRAAVMFERGGETGGSVNIGTWQSAVDPAAIDQLFQTLGAVNCREIKEIHSDDPVDGGGSELYEIEYESGGSFALWFVEGATYSGAESITGPVLRFIEQCPLPTEATPRFVLHDDGG